MNDDTDTTEEVTTAAPRRSPSRRKESVPAPTNPTPLSPVEVMPALMTEAELHASRMALLRSEVEKGKALASAQWKEDCDFATRTGCPPPPKKNPQFGDKSRDFVQWLHDYRHDEFIKRFGVTRKGKVPVVETNRDTGLDEVTGYREVYFARAKTHLTEVDRIDNSLGDDMDWNA